MTRSISFAVLCVSMVLWGIGCVRAEPSAWPLINEKSGSVVFDKPTEADFAVDIQSLDGHPLYELRCRSGDLDDVDDFNYSGLLQCRLSMVNATRGMPKSLLFEDLKATSDWDGRGRFMLNDVLGSCGRNPDWGSNRNYRVRGMQLTLGIENVRLHMLENGDVSVASFVFSYSVKPNRQAIGALAEKAATREPAWFSGGEVCLEEAKAAAKGE